MADYATGGPDWLPCDAGTPGAVAIVYAELPAEGTYQILSSVLFDIDGVPNRQFSFIALPTEGEG